MAQRKLDQGKSHVSELIIITGLSGSGKATVLKALEDLGYYAVDNLPIGLLPKFAELAKDSLHVRRAALVIDIREGQKLAQFPAIFRRMRRQVPATLLFLEADDRTLVRRFSETRRPHPLGIEESVIKNIRTERKRLAPIRAVADHVINTSKFNVHELRDVIEGKFGGGPERMPTSASTSPASDTGTAFRPTATWSLTCASCRIPTTSRSSRT